MCDSIKATKQMIEKQVSDRKISVFGVPFSKYQKVYASTNENINGYMKKLDFKDKTSTLSVMASGDHAFNAAFYGIKDIDTFDTNVLTQYYALGIKRSAILTFSYKKYLLFLNKILDENISLEELTEIIKSLLSYMDYEFKLYWEEVLSYNYLVQKDSKNPLNLFHMLLINIQGAIKNPINNAYLLSEENYNILKNNLSKVNFSFQNIECFELPNKIKKQYDFIFLSNIADYFYKQFDYGWTYDKLKKIEEEFKQIQKDNGLLVLAYVYKIYLLNIDKYMTHPIKNSKVKVSDLKTEQLITFSSVVDNKECKPVHDGLILSRKK